MIHLALNFKKINHGSTVYVRGLPSEMLINVGLPTSSHFMSLNNIQCCNFSSMLRCRYVKSLDTLHLQRVFTYCTSSTSHFSNVEYGEV